MSRSLRLPAFDLSLLVNAFLGTAIGLQLAWMLTGAFGAHEAASIVETRPTPSVPSIEAIKAARLFGTQDGSATATEAAAPVSTQGLVLVGVLAATDPRGGQAIIGESAGGARVYSVGGTLPGGSRLAEVYGDRVILDRGGSFETLPLPRQGGTPSAAPVTTANPSSAPLPGMAVATNDITNVIRWQAVLRTDKPSGVRVYPGADARMFGQLGLRPGDLVMAVNDTPLADQANGEQFLRSLSGTPQARLTIERGGRTETLLIDLTQIGNAPQ